MADPGTQWDERLRAAGLRSTSQRRAVLAALHVLRHATVDELATHVQLANPDLSLSTVYRTLEALDEVGLVTHAHLHHGSPTYHTVDEDPHIHLVCSRCGDVQQESVEVARPMVATILETAGFSIDVAHLALHGWCARCAGAHAGSQDPRPVLNPS